MKTNPNKFDIKEWKNINIEDVFTFLDVGEKMFNTGTCYYTAFHEHKEQLIKLIVLQIMLRCEGKRCEYLETLFKNIKPQDSIISFNWDTLADITLAYLNNSQYINYLKIMSDTSIENKNYKNLGILLKLHGSINWGICKNIKCIEYNKIALVFSSVPDSSTHLPISYMSKCEKCNKEFKPFIIPPTSNKMIIHKNSFIHKLWLIAKDKLLTTSKIVFVGYSFPVTDFYTEWLFRQVHFLTGEKHEIVVVNPEFKKRNSEVSKRYKGIFKGHKIVTFNTLKEYVNSLL